MSVTAPKGFIAAGVTCGLKASGKPDLALVQNTGPHKSAASVFTSNRCKANPVLWSEQVMADGIVEAVVLNSGGANCYTGAPGFQVTHSTAEAVGEALGIAAGDVVVCSTGLIGLDLDLDKLRNGVELAAEALTAMDAHSEDAGHRAATAIMTTDSVAKTAAVTGAGYTIGGMAKGAGMLAPGLATMLVVITTDAHLEPGPLDQALRAATRVTFDRLDSDGCMSTNDTVTLMASGASEVVPDLAEFTFEVRSVPGDDPVAVRDGLLAFLEGTVMPPLRAVAPAARAGITQRSHLPAFDLPEDSALALMMQRLTGHNRVARVSYGTEAGFFHDSGIATIVCGPGHIAQAHQPEEWVAESELAACLDFLDRLAATLVT